MVNIVLSFEDNYNFEFYINKKKHFNWERWTVFRNIPLSLCSALNNGYNRELSIIKGGMSQSVD
jgi:hypothetical protein